MVGVDLNVPEQAGREFDNSKRSDVEKRAFHLFGLRASEMYRMMNSSTNGRCYGEYIHDDSKLSNTSPTP
jgi:hypothetical protein